MGKRRKPQQDEQQVTKSVASVVPEVTFGVAKLGDGKHLAVCTVTQGEVVLTREVLTPRRHGGDTGESKALAWSRALGAAGEFARRRES